MIKSFLYSLSPQSLEHNWREVVAACRRQGIGEVSILAAVTGKLTASADELRLWKERLEGEGLKVSAMIFAVGHPAMESYYSADGSLKGNPWYEGGLVGNGDWHSLAALPRSWQYAVNEFGQNVYCSACPNAAWRRGNVTVIREIATVFDEIWYDDEYRTDSDQWGGRSLASSASCYCDQCMAELSQRLGRSVVRQDVLSDQAVHEAWVTMKERHLTDGWRAFAAAGRAVNPKLALGLMVRWGGEERDGLDLSALASVMDRPLLWRAGEGHFGAEEYAQPVSQVLEYLAVTYHVSWVAPQAVVRSETTYFAPMSAAQILKKIALSLAAGAGRLAYCCCVPEGVNYQRFLEHEQSRLKDWACDFENKQTLRGIAIMRTRAAAVGDKNPVQRCRDRQPFPLLSLAGMCAHVVRAGSWREDSGAMVAVTGRSIWDYFWRDGQPLVVDGAALLEQSPANKRLGISDVAKGRGGEVRFVGTDWQADGKLWRRLNQVLIPVVWQDIPADELDGWLREIRRVLGPLVDSAVIGGDLGVLPVEHSTAVGSVVMLVNLTTQPRHVRLRWSRRTRDETRDETRDDGMELNLQAEEIRVVHRAKGC